MQNEEKENKKRSLTSSIEVPFVEDAIKEEAIETTKLDSKGRASATGRRKRASARIWLSIGDSFTINHTDCNVYFPQSALRKYIFEPLEAVGLSSAKIFSTVCGGGKVGQAGALRHGISRALVNFDPSFKSILSSGGFLMRDSRKKERKTPGFRTARKPQQFSKR
jgi:small subunit ribosomal protein S9